MTTGYLIDVQHFSVNDGDGIRSTIFFAGCNMRCQWCANPESFTTFDKILHSAASCIACGRCEMVCPYGVGIDLSDPMERQKCRSCGRCVGVCPSGSRRSAIRQVSVEELIKEVEKYRLFYRYSGGGITFSGGEASRQLRFLDELSEALYDSGIDLALETNGDFDYEQMKPILSRLAMCFIDIKHLDPKAHRRWTGVSNDNTLENIKRIGQTDLPLIIRIPLIETVNAKDDLIREIARWLKAHVRRPRIELLPYHAYGEIKYQALGLRPPDKRFATPSNDLIARLEAIITQEGVTLEHFK
ncbi:MAG TPA: glycyl-radical enzyme activating protein [Tissierellia bacterium]|nr:glycyl-radical enzyme activating protein [Tissierellia bacterium]